MPPQNKRRRTCQKIVNWPRTLTFPREANLSAEARDLILRLICNAEQRLGANGTDDLKVCLGIHAIGHAAVATGFL